MQARQVSHGPFAVDLAARVALRDGEPLPVGQRGAVILGTLLSRPGEVLTKSELLDAAWGGAAIEESNLSVQVAALRKALGPSPDGGDWIATIPRVGYRLTVPVAPEATLNGAANLPTLAVMPFEALTPVPDGMTDGMREQVIVALAGFPDMLVLNRRMSADDALEDPCAFAADLGASHVLVGSLRGDGRRIRVSARFLDSATGAATWAESWQRDLADPFAVEEEVARLIAAGVRGAVKPDESPSEIIRLPRNPEASAHYARGLAMLLGQTQNAEVFRLTVERFEQAVAIEPDFAPAIACLAEIHFIDAANGWSGDRRAAIVRARELADRAVATDRNETSAWAVSSLVALGERDIARAAHDTDMALEINPNDPMALAVRGNVLSAQGRPLEAIPCLEQSMRISSASHMYALHHLALAYLAAGRNETAAALLRERVALVPGTDMSRGYLAAALCQLGDYDGARRVWAELMTINPEWSLSRRAQEGMLTATPEVSARLVAGLRAAGIDG